MESMKSGQLVMDIKRLTESIKRKHRALRHGELDASRIMEERFRPIIKPLQHIASKIESSNVKPESTFEEQDVSSASMVVEKQVEEPLSIGNLARHYIDAANTSTKHNEFDHIYGIHFNPDTGQWQIGRSTVTFDGNQIMLDGTQMFVGTRGLYELLFMINPSTYKDTDLKRYKRILNISGAHLDGRGRVKRNTGAKYKNVIARIFPPTVSKRGKGMFIQDTPAPPKYVYWDDVNELCDRLRVLISSKQAGHTGHDIEIASIIEELRENGVIVGGQLKIPVSLA